MSEEVERPVWAMIVGLLALVSVHLFGGKVKLLRVIPRSRWLSFGSGISVAYVFLHLLPELARSQAVVEETFEMRWMENHVFVLALCGLTAFYGLERLAAASRGDAAGLGEPDRTSPPVFWLHILSFALYNVLIGYLAFQVEEGSALMFFVAMGLHFFVNDYGLSEHHKEAYRRQGRWIVSAAVLIGGALGFGTNLPEAFVSSAVALLAGGVILNVLKEELPEKRASRFAAFFLGAAGYAVMLLFVE